MKKRPFFVELPVKHDKNRGIMNASSCAPAQLANGEPGVMNIIGNTLVVMSEREMLEVVSMWGDALEAAKARSARDAA